MKFGIVTFPGSNCDWDCHYVISDVLKQKAQFIWHKETKIPKLDVIIIPGGFSYGDYLRTGAVARFSPVMQEVVRFANGGGKVIGICNGFQVLTEAGLLPGVLMRNRGLKFVCEKTPLKVVNTRSLFSKKYSLNESLHIPIAHGEGNYFVDDETLKKIEDQGQVIFRYLKNPNGSKNDIAGLVNDKGNVLGMMPHPERCMEQSLSSEDGRKVFESLL